MPPAEATALAADYGAAQLDGLRRALGAVAIFALLAFWFTRKLPGPIADPAEHVAVAQAPAAAS